MLSLRTAAGTIGRSAFRTPDLLPPADAQGEDGCAIFEVESSQIIIFKVMMNNDDARIAIDP